MPPKKGKGKLPLFHGNREWVIPIYSPWAQIQNNPQENFAEPRTNCKVPPSQEHNYFHNYMVVDISQATHFYICGSRIPFHMTGRSIFPFEDGAGISLYQKYLTKLPN